VNNSTERPDDTGIAPGEVREIGFLQALWSLFSSMKTAIILLLILAVASVIGTVVPQDPNPNPDNYVMSYGMWVTKGLVWLHLAPKSPDPQVQMVSYDQIASYGHRVFAAFQTLDLMNVYHSRWYVLLLSLIGVNLAVCSINRFGIAWRRTFNQKVAAKPEQIRNMQRSAAMSFSGTVESAVEKIVTALRSGSYHIVKEQNSAEVSILASRRRIGIWGPYMTHLSILVIFAGAILGNQLGFDGYVTITEGKYVDSYFIRGEGPAKMKDLGFRVALRKFTIDYDKNHNATQYKSDLRAYEGDKLVARKVIDVNHPLTYKGVSFFQSDYGLAGFVIKVTAPNGEVARIPFKIETRDAPRGKEYALAGEPFQTVTLGGKKLTVFVHNFAPDYVGPPMVNLSFMPLNPAAQVLANDRFPEYKGLEAWTRLGWLTQSDSAEYKGFRITMEDAIDYTGLQVARNPALPVIYSGFGMLLIGVFIAFYVTHRLIRVRISRSKSGAEIVIGGMARGEPSVLDRDFDRLRESLA
jgi:cytochrome c biogenesis protein